LEVFATYERPWWIAGGLAIDAFVGHDTRSHDDTDVGVLCRDQQEVRNVLHGLGWELWAAGGSGSLRVWDGSNEEPLPLEVHSVWCRLGASAPWSFELMLERTRAEEWLYRRDERVARPISSIKVELGGYPYMAAEVQLLYKAASSAGIRPKDEQDFAACRPLLSRGQAAWLATALRLAHPAHPWIESLGG
jgi:hypothetical protein